MSPTEIPVPFRGAAPAPQRRVNYADIAGGGAPQPNTIDPQANRGITYEQSLPPAPHYHGNITSPPPPAPETAAELAAARSENGALRAKIGEQDAKLKDLTRAQEDMRIRFELAGMAGSNAPGLPAMPPLPADVDPNQTMTVGDFARVANAVFPAMEQGVVAQTIRAAWDVSPAEVQTIERDYPQLASVREPDRTRKIQEIARTRRAYDAPATPAPTAAAPLAPLATPIQVVPMVEGTTTPYTGEPSRQDPLEEARRAYEAADQMPVRSTADIKARLARKRDAFDEMNRLGGITEEMQRNAYSRSSR